MTFVSSSSSIIAMSRLQISPMAFVILHHFIMPLSLKLDEDLQWVSNVLGRDYPNVLYFSIDGLSCFVR